MRIVSLHKFALSCIFWLMSWAIFAQDSPAKEKAIGVVTYITSQNVYLRFENTSVLQINDTIYKTSKSGELTPCLVLMQKSSVSCITEPIGKCELTKGDEVVYFYTNRPVKEEKIIETAKVDSTAKPKVTGEILPEKSGAQKVFPEGVGGMVSLQNNTTTGRGDYNNRTVARLALNAKNIGGSNFSFYSSSRARFNRVSRSDVLATNNRLSVYEFVLKYDNDSSITVSLGRSFNNRILSAGTMDGLSAEKRWKHVFVGAVVGSRPNPIDYGLNFNLFQYGAYIGVFHDKNKSSNTSVGAIDQRNGSFTDRRYVFMQHRSNIGDKINLFASSELDIYKRDTTGIGSGNLRLTSLYFSLNYRITRKLSLMASFDSRRNRILYESFSDNLDRLIYSDPIRNGYRVRVNYRISNSIYTGASGNFRAQSDSKSTFRNINVFLNFTRLPLIGGSWSNTFSNNGNDYFNYFSISSRYTKDFFKNKLTVSPSGRFISYNYIKYELDPIMQYYLAIDLYYNITKKMSFGFDYEYSKRGAYDYHRFNTQLIQRF